MKFVKIIKFIALDVSVTKYIFIFGLFVSYFDCVTAHDLTN